MKKTRKFNPLPYFAVIMASLLVLNAVFGVPLRPDQHAALMALYDGIQIGNFSLYFLSSAVCVRMRWFALMKMN